MGPAAQALIDTSVVIELGDPALGDHLPAALAVSVATLAELHVGVLRAADDRSRQTRLTRLGTVEATFQTLPIDAGTARHYAGLADALHRATRQPRRRVMDLWIAATAAQHRVPLYTRNPGDFRGLEAMVDVRVI